MLRSLITRWRGTPPGETVSVAGAPAAGSIYAFRTTPFTEFGPPETGRWAALKVIGATDELIVVAVLDLIRTAPPALKEATRAAILREHRFACTGQQAVCGISASLWEPSGLRDLTLLGAGRLSGAERRHVKRHLTGEAGSCYSTMSFADVTAEGEWRWAHDRVTVTAEYERKRARMASEAAAREERYRTRLKGLTWDQLLTEVPFQNWTPSPPYPPKEFTLAARKTIHATCRSLQALGPRPRKGDVRQLLKHCVEGFNQADERAGGVIETEEREDICAILEEMAFVARQKSLVEEIDEWRDW